MMVLYTIVILCILIFVHELGHYGAAKLLRVRVYEFAIGIGPAFFKRQYGETKYSLRVLPIGGFCALGEDEEAVDERSFGNKPVWVRTIILAAGSLMNIALAIIIMSAMIFYAGTAVTMVVKSVTAESPAYSAGMLSGDEIVAIDGVKTEKWTDITRLITESDSDRINIEIIRGGDRLSLTTGVIIAEDGRRIIGISPKVERNPLTALVQGTKASYGLLKYMADILGQLFTGRVPITDMTGLVGIAHIVDVTAKEGMRPLLYLVALISLNLAIVNLLPFPALDGGRLLFLFIRRITGKAITDSMETWFHMIGMVLLLALMVFITWNDIEKLVTGTFWP